MVKDRFRYLYNWIWGVSGSVGTSRVGSNISDLMNQGYHRYSFLYANYDVIEVKKIIFFVIEKLGRKLVHQQAVCSESLVLHGEGTRALVDTKSRCLNSLFFVGASSSLRQNDSEVVMVESRIIQASGVLATPLAE